MHIRRLAALAGLAIAVCAAALGVAVAQDAPGPEIPLPPDGQPCRIDAELSLWLAQESVDRTIAALERERRSLIGQQAGTRRALDLLARADHVEGVPLAEVDALLDAQSAGRDALDGARAEIEARLVEIDRTLDRRRKQQATLEARIDALAEASAR